MLKKLFICWILIVQAVAGSARAADDAVPETLLGMRITFSNIAKVRAFGLNTIVMVPRKEDGGGFVVVAIDRRNLTEDFVHRFFSTSTSLLDTHPFASNGIEAILSEKDLLLKLHPGVALNLRQGMPSDPSYKTFSGSSITARVIEHRGRAYVSTQPKQVQSNAGDVFVVLLGKRGKEESVRVLPDGSRLIIGAPVTENDFPPQFKPKMQ